VEALRLAYSFRPASSMPHRGFVFEITVANRQIESFISRMLPLGLVDVSRTGVVAIARGPEAM